MLKRSSALKKVLTFAAVQALVCTSLYAGADQDPFAILKKATTLLESSQSISVNGIASADFVDDDLLKVQNNFNLEILVQRPDKVYSVKTGDENQKVYFDGRLFTVLNTLENVYAQKPINGSLDELSSTLEEENVSAPLLDLLRTNFYDLLVEVTKTAKYLGESKIQGENCSHLVFRTPEVDWQVWVSAGRQATICRSLITTKKLAGGPQYEVTFRGWNFNTQISDDQFQFVPPQGAMEIEFIPGQLGFNE